MPIRQPSPRLPLFTSIESIGAKGWAGSFAPMHLAKHKRKVMVLDDRLHLGQWRRCRAGRTDSIHPEGRAVLPHLVWHN